MGGNFNNEQIEKFVLDLMAEKAENLDEQDRETEKDRLVSLLGNKVEDAIAECLPDDKVEALDKLVEERGEDATEEEITALVYSSQLDINEVVKKTMEEFRDSYLKGEV
ncbi:hypothetical protein IKG45_01970 [Candidatus Saccharibacteria bacterium]|nr:hypothetical protein [Candidatus Saccharibacteria bacterium]